MFRVLFRVQIRSNPAENMSDAGFALFCLDDISALTLKTLKVTLIFTIQITISTYVLQSFVRRVPAKVIFTLRTANSLDTAAEKKPSDNLRHI